MLVRLSSDIKSQPGKKRQKAKRRKSESKTGSYENSVNWNKGIIWQTRLRHFVPFYSLNCQLYQQINRFRVILKITPNFAFRY